VIDRAFPARTARTARFALVTAALVAACTRPPAAAPAEVSAAGAASPLLRTTSGEIATRNLEAELAQAERQHGARPSDPVRTRALVDRLLLRAQLYGRLADYDRADALAQAAVALAPDSGDARLLRARVEAALHQFPKTLAELDRARRLGADQDAVQHVRVGVWQATGRLDEALVYLRAWRRDRPDLTTYAAEAAALADRRDYPRAEAAFSEARRHYADVSPFAVAWLEFQEGHMWESAGRSDRARPLFEAALGRLPGYAAAAAHLARIAAAFGDPAGLRQAADLVEPLVARSDDPEYLGQLGGLYGQTGRGAEGAGLVRRAARAYDALLARHPEAFYDHAARFFLHVGGDPWRARALAEKNLALRPTAEARDLRAEAERAAAVAPLSAKRATTTDPLAEMSVP
jgi:tetratricopeptide (TPR) repeat protein